eukprot:2883329-Alexandrium_andersonii.AAC.1
MREEYGHAIKVLGEYTKPGAVFPPEGLGVGATPGDLADKAIKLMACNLIKLGCGDRRLEAAGAGRRQLGDCL